MAFELLAIFLLVLSCAVAPQADSISPAFSRFNKPPFVVPLKNYPQLKS